MKSERLRLNENKSNTIKNSILRFSFKTIGHLVRIVTVTFNKSIFLKNFKLVYLKAFVSFLLVNSKSTWIVACEH